MGRITITDLQVKVAELEAVLNQHRNREEEYGVNRSCISKIINNSHWRM